MEHKNDLEFEQTLAESEWLLRDAARSASDEAEPTLESILAEFGSGRPQSEAPAEDISLPAAPEPVRAETPRDIAPPSPSAGSEGAPAPEETVSLQDVLESTVQSVLDEGAAEAPELLPPKRRGLFSRKNLRDTEPLYSDASPEASE